MIILRKGKKNLIETCLSHSGYWCSYLAVLHDACTKEGGLNGLLVALFDAPNAHCALVHSIVKNAANESNRVSYIYY
jgi:hypothetical protein